MRKKLISLALCVPVLALALCCAPIKALAESGTALVASGSSAIKSPSSTTSSFPAWCGDYVYFGTYDGVPVKFRVLNTSETSFGGSTMLLDSDTLLKMFPPAVPFTDTEANKGTEQLLKSINDWMNGSAAGQFLNGFSAAELGAVASSVKAGDDVSKLEDYSVYSPALTGVKVFGLSADEAATRAYGYVNNKTRLKSGGNGRWWLRSDISATSYEYLIDVGGYKVDSNGNLITDSSGNYIATPGSIDGFDLSFYTDKYNGAFYLGASPALNIKLSSIVFTTPAAQEKPSSLTAVSGSSSGEWRLTVADSGDFSAGAASSATSVAQGGTVTITHKALSELSGTYSNVTAAIKDSSGKIVYYGSVDSSVSSTSSSFTIPSSLAEGNYTLSVYGEDWNGAYHTDSATGTPFTTSLSVAKSADYTVVDKAISNVPTDLSKYTDASVAKLKAAIDAIIRGKSSSEQNTVDAYAAALTEAIDELVPKSAAVENPKTGSGSAALPTALSVISGSVLIIGARRRRKAEA